MALFLNPAHAKANDWVSGFQDPFGKTLSSINDPIVAAAQAGTLTYQQANDALTQFNEQWSSLNAAAEQFQAKGGDYATAVQQAYGNVKVGTDPFADPNAGPSGSEFLDTVRQVQSFLTNQVASLKPADGSSSADTATPAPTLLTTTQQTDGGQTPAQAAAAAAERTKDQSVGGGRSSTILTGPQGLTMLTGLQRQAQSKTLLGYAK